MKVLLINSVCGVGSTGRIVVNLAKEFLARGDEVKIAYGRRSAVPEQLQGCSIRIGSDISCCIHMLQTRLFDAHGFGSKRATRDFLQWAEAYQPDLLWLHNIHGYYINVEMLFAWIKKHPNMQVKWTLHDCWAVTGHCSHFTWAGCERWKNRCQSCPELREYPSCYGKGRVESNHERKRGAFTGVRHLTLVAPCQWIAQIAKQSYLKEYPVEVCYNTIDATVFKPTPSFFREDHGLRDKRMVLGVSYMWDERKGLNDFLKLAEMLGGCYAIVLVGLTDRQIRSIPRWIPGLRRVSDSREQEAVFAGPEEEKARAGENANWEECDSKVIPQGADAAYEAITGHRWGGEKHTVARLVCIPRTNNPQELAAIYTAADVFLNPTYEDTYPTVNLEAQACGTRVITYDTGGCAETLGVGRSAKGHEGR